MTTLGRLNAGARFWLGCFAGWMSLAGPIQAQEETWANHLRAGVQVGLNLKADFRVTGPATVSGSQPGPTRVRAVDHFYDDGYVRVDQTGNAQGYTSFWGYQNASQYDPASQTLILHSASTLTASAETAQDAGPQVGADLAYGRDFAQWGTAWIGGELGFGFLPVTIKDTQPTSAMFTRNVHSFNTGGIAMPTAPYHGGASGLGPTLDDVATALPDEAIRGTITGSRTLDVSFFTIRMGPTVRWEPHPDWAVAASAGFALGIASGDYTFAEAIALADSGSTLNSGKVEGTDVSFGGYVSALVIYRAVKQGDLFVGVQFTPMTDASFSGGGREARLDLGAGFSLTAGFNWPF